MSKSKGNFITVQELKEKGYDPLALRYLFLNSHYKKGIEFSWEALDAASNALLRLRNQLNSIKNDTRRESLSSEKLSKLDYFRDSFMGALADDLNTPIALSFVWEALKSNIPSSDKYDLIVFFDEVLGLKLSEFSFDIPEEIKKLAEIRASLRKEGKFEEADKIRQEIESKGFGVSDLPDRTEVYPIKNA